MTKFRILFSKNRVAFGRDPQSPRPEIHAPAKGAAIGGSPRADGKMAQPALTARETEVLKFVAEGLTNEQTAVQMKVSVKTVQKHRQALMNKLNLHHTAGLARYAVSQGNLFEEDFHRTLARRFNGRAPEFAHAREQMGPAKQITPRETQVLRLIADGCVNKQIAAELNISIKTVGNHRLELMKRLCIHHVAGLTRYAMSNGLVALNMQISAAGSHAQGIAASAIV